MFCDLHNHSTASDGTFTPTQIAEEAARIGLSAVALTDHSTVAGLPEFVQAVQKLGVEAVPGIEFSVDYGSKELHMLALFVREENYDRINKMLEIANRNSEQSKRDLVARLKQRGYELDYDEIREKSHGVNINRAHIAAEMVRKGQISSIKEAFDTLLDKKFGLYVEPKRLDAFEVIETIREMGAVAVLAHPFLNLSETELCTFLEKAVPRGLDGMEVFYSRYDDATTKKAAEIAAYYGIESSGGSDFHGENKPDISMGTGEGELAVPYEWYLRLKAIHESRK